MESEARDARAGPPPPAAGAAEGAGPGVDLALARRVAVEAVLTASRLARSVQADLGEGDVVSKQDFSPVTVADFGAQAVISHLLLEAFPGVPLMGEEDAATLQAEPRLLASVVRCVRAERPEISEQQAIAGIDRGQHEGGRGLFWVLDPIDGTKGFLRRGQYAVCLALVYEGQVLVAVLGCPNLPVDPARPEGERGCLFVAVHGQGATQLDIPTGSERRIHVDGNADPSSGPVVEQVASGHTNYGRQADLKQALNITRPSVRMDSQCKFGVVARGEASLYLRLGDKDQKIWDIAAGAKIVEEAGGKCSDAQGRPLDFAHGRTIGVGALFASNGLIHERVLAAL